MKRKKNKRKTEIINEYCVISYSVLSLRLSSHCECLALVYNLLFHAISLDTSSLMLLLSLTNLSEQMIAILMTEINHTWLPLCLLQLFGFPINRGSPISIILSGKAIWSNPCSSKPSLMMSSNGLFPVNISIRRVPLF